MSAVVGLLALGTRARGGAGRLGGSPEESHYLFTSHLSIEFVLFLKLL